MHVPSSKRRQHAGQKNDRPIPDLHQATPLSWDDASRSIPVECSGKSSGRQEVHKYMNY